MRTFPYQALRFLDKVKTSQEGVIRLCVSRYYYAALHVLALKLDEVFGIDWSSKRIHQLVPSKLGPLIFYYLGETEESKKLAKTCHKLFEELRDFRKIADYEPYITVKRALLEDARERAHALFRLIRILK